MIFNDKVLPLRRVEILANKIKQHAEDGDKIITLGEYTIHKGGNDLNPSLYYYAGMQGWSLNHKQWNLRYVRSLIERGATLFSARKSSREPEASKFLKKMKNNYKILYENKDQDLLLLKLN